MSQTVSGNEMLVSKASLTFYTLKMYVLNCVECCRQHSDLNGLNKKSFFSRSLLPKFSLRFLCSVILVSRETIKDHVVQRSDEMHNCMLCFILQPDWQHQ